MNNKKISIEQKEGIYYLGFGEHETKSLTVISEETLLEMDEALSEIKGDKNAKGLVLFSHKPGCFLAGMDVSVIQSLTSEIEASQGCEKGQEVFNKLEDLKIPTMALVDGVCLGGGLEMALSCDKIICSDNKKTALGLPEVMLGVLPGFGGTYRLPRKIGLTTSLDLLLTGKQVKAKKAKRMGLVEAVMPAERLLEKAAEYLFKKESHNKTFQETLTEKASENFLARGVIFRKARQTVLEKTKGFYPAPLKILEHLEASFGKRRSSYLSNEARMFGELSQTSQSKALQHVFFLHDNAKKLEQKDKISSVRQGAVLGGGTMGGGIAWLMANSNQSPILKDINLEGLELGLKQSSSVFEKALKRRKITKDEFERKQRSIKPSLSFDGFQRSHLVIEAVVENMDIKKKVFSEVENYVSDDCLLTTNTSSLSINEMAKALKNSSRFAGLHFFNPVNKMPLVEIIRHEGVSEETINRLYKWVLDVKKTPIVVNDCPGFLVNRILAPFLNESAYLLEQGVSIESIDKAVLNFGMPMGACRLMDEVGIDVCSHVGEIMEAGLGPRAKANQLSHKAVEAGLLGKKNGKGFYLYDDSGKQQDINPDILKLLPDQKTEMDETTIQMRLILPMINEAANILDEKIVDSADTVDLGLIFGIGFPPFRGGLLKYADSEGLERIKGAIEKFASEVNEQRYELSPYLKKLVENKQKFYEL
ncbi:MAG: 3-hydroxyacyl-CoA dehydrogenase NAD-binding domain-containing protein [Bacteriovoracaceae bacterium]|jgi:3-hydroxyacyl-CoA dehydrogenase/enoyl-CoA hydratase/3-hydroxybutyryl-CoA epimerase|nr:fatty acid oxidation complex subunit alpha FadJ [Halobacteriovoraceae bacterium]MDP7319989.1 3-hydroxyacyl-CoA dehydrogenase NAD-binding domain-containing protein [Bacteriovoracaceae bacterium]